MSVIKITALPASTFIFQFVLVQAGYLWQQSFHPVPPQKIF